MRNFGFVYILIILIRRQLILTSFFEGVWDSIKNIVVVFYLDREMNKKLAAQNEKVANQDTKKSNKENQKKKE